MQRPELEALVADMAGLLGVPPGCLKPLRSPDDVAALVRDFLVNTVGMPT